MGVTHNHLEVTGRKPTTLEIDKAEIAINLVDKTIWTKDNVGTVVNLGEVYDDTAIWAAVDLNTAKETNVTTNLGYTASPTDGTVTSSDGTDATLPLANGTNAGLLAPGDFSKLGGIEAGAEVNNISDVNAGLLTGAADTTLHFHASDRNRANHTGTQLLATISDAGTAAAADTGVASGNVPVLDGSGWINPSVLPPLAITSTFVAIDQAAQLALTVQEGDVAVRTDENKSYIALNSDNVDMGDWQELLSPTAAGTNLAIGTNNTTTQQITSSTGTNVDLVVASSTLAGIMTSAMYDDHVLNNAKVTNVTTDLGYTASPTDGTVTSSDGTNATLPLANTTNAGLLKPADFDKLALITVDAAVDLNGSLLTGELI